MSPASEHRRMAALVQRLAVLSAAGLAPLAAWEHAAASSGDDRARAVPEGIPSGAELPVRIAEAAQGTAPGSGWRVLAAVWIAATEAGAALAPALERAAGVLRDLAQSAREVDVALAGPTATSRVVLALPGVAVLLGVLLGFDMLAAFASPAGIACILAGGALLVVAARWNRRLVRAASASDAAAGLALDLVAVALAGGSAPDRALAAATSACERAGLPPPGEEVDRLLAFAATAGVPVGGLLRAEADEARRSVRADAAERAARLETRLLLPLGLCVLPAFALLGVVPVVLAIVSSTATAL